MDPSELHKDLCRMCAQVDQGMNIFSETAQKQNVFIKIKVCLPITVTMNDELTTHICCDCLKKLNVAYDLCTSSLAVQNKIREITRERKGATENVPSKNIKPHVNLSSVQNASSTTPTNTLVPANSKPESRLGESNGNNNDSNLVIQSVLSLSENSEPESHSDSSSSRARKSTDDESSSPRKKDRRTVCQYCCKWFPRSMIASHENCHANTEISISCFRCNQLFPTHDDFYKHDCNG